MPGLILSQANITLAESPGILFQAGLSCPLSTHYLADKKDQPYFSQTFHGRDFKQRILLAADPALEIPALISS